MEEQPVQGGIAFPELDRAQRQAYVDRLGEDQACCKLRRG